MGLNKKEIHLTHKMTEWHTEVRAPAGTPRFYGVRECEYCGAEESKHPAGHFVDGELYERCCENPKVILTKENWEENNITMA